MCFDRSPETSSYGYPLGGGKQCLRRLCQTGRADPIMGKDLKLAAGVGVLVGDTDNLQGAEQPRLHQQGGHRTAKPAIDTVLFNRDDCLRPARCSEDGSDVERAQQHYRDALGFEITWLYPDKEIGAVSRGDVGIFFRKKDRPFEPAIHWVFADDIDATYDELKSLGANIVEPLEIKPWGLRQFTVEDLDGNRFYFHHD